MAGEKLKDAGIRLKVEGETEFKKSLGAVTHDLRMSSSELQRLKVAMKDNGRSTELLSKTYTALSKQMTDQATKINLLKARYDEVANAQGDNSQEAQKLSRQIYQAETQYAKLESQLQAVARELATQQNKVLQLGVSMQTLGGTLTKTGDKILGVGKALSLGVSLPLAGIGALAIKSAIDFESAFAGVRKTVDATESEFQELSDGIRQLAKEMPASASEIASVAEAAGQLGVSNPYILSFTESMVNLGVSTNMSANEAATGLARIANIMQMSEGNYERLGSVVVALGNNYATTEAEIVDMSLRLAGAGHQVGMTEAQVLALSAALSSVGVSSEAGGSALSKVMLEIDMAVASGVESVQGFAEIAGQSADQFSEKWKVDAAGAMVDFVEGLGKVKEEGGNAAMVLNELDLSEIRVRMSMMNTAGAGDLLRRAMETGNTAWRENTALANEAAERYKTTESQMQMLKNQAIDVAIKFGNDMIPVLKDLMQNLSGLVEWFGNLDPGMRSMIIKAAGIAVALGPVLSIIGSITKAGGGLLTVGGGLLKLIGNSSTAMGVLTKIMPQVAASIAVKTTAMTAEAAATGTAAAANTGFIATLAPLLPVLGLVAGAVALVVGGMALWDAAWTDSAEANEQTAGTLGNLRASVMGLSEPMTEFTPAVEEAAIEMGLLREQIENTNNAVGDMTAQMQIATQGMSEETAKAATETAASLSGLTNDFINFSTTTQGIDKTTADALMSSMSTYTERARQELETRHNDKLAALQKDYESGKIANEQTYNSLVAEQTRLRDTELEMINGTQTQIYDILSRAGEEKRILTATEIDTVVGLLNNQYAPQVLGAYASTEEQKASLQASYNDQAMESQRTTLSTILTDTFANNQERLNALVQYNETAKANVADFEEKANELRAQGKNDEAAIYDEKALNMQAYVESSNREIEALRTGNELINGSYQTMFTKLDTYYMNATKTNQAYTDKYNMNGQNRDQTTQKNINKIIEWNSTKMEDKEANVTVNYKTTGSPGSSMGISPSIPQMATGGLLRGSMALVGEAGPELLKQTPHGTQVIPLSDREKKEGISGQLASKQPVQITFVVNSKEMASELIDDINKLNDIKFRVGGR